MPWDISSYSTTPSLNTAINGIDIAENSAAAGYNNALRQIMADIKTWTNAYAVSYPISIANGGTGQTTAAAAFNALAAGDRSINGKLTRTSYGVHPHFASTSMTGGRFYVQAAGADPTADPGDIVFEY